MEKPPKYDEREIAEMIENQIDFWIEQKHEEEQDQIDE